MSELSATFRPSGPDYVYPAQVVEVIDGDTLRVRIDLGFDVQSTKSIRLRDIDTREIHFVEHESEEYVRGMTHKRAVDNWVSETIDASTADAPFYFYSHEYESGVYGRTIGDLWSPVHESWLSRHLFSKFDDVTVYE